MVHIYSFFLAVYLDQTNFFHDIQNLKLFFTQNLYYI